MVGLVLAMEVMYNGRSCVDYGSLMVGLVLAMEV